MKNLFASEHPGRPQGINTRITSYYLNVSNPDEKRAYEKIKAERKRAGVRLFDFISTGKFHPFVTEDQTITLETEHPFNNQWSTTDGRRVFDWSEEICYDRDIKMGHYLQITDEMIALRETVYKCGYCGHNFYGHENAGKFCYDCLDSEYLKISDIFLLRVIPVSQDGQKRPALSQEEESVLIPLYTHAQTKGTTTRGIARIAKKRAEIIACGTKEISNAKTKMKGYLWMMDRGINTENVIFYDHTGLFCIGWRNPITFETEQEFNKLMKGFPYEFEYKYA